MAPEKPRVGPSRGETAEDSTAPPSILNDPRLVDILIHSSLMAIGVADPEGHMVFANDELLRMWGYESQAEMIGQPIGSFLLDEDYRQAQRELLETGAASGTVIGRKKDGSCFDARFASVLVRNPDGLPKYMVGSFLDITDHNRAMDALEKSVAEYRDLVESAKIAIVVDDADGNFRYSNREFADMFGYSPDEVGALSIATLVHPDDVERVLSFHERRLKGGEVPSRYEFRGLKKDGSVIHLEVRPVELVEDGQPVGTRSYIWDITDRRRAAEALQRSEATFNTLFKAAPIGIGLVVDRVFQMVNDEMCALTGYRPDELEGQNARIIYESDEEFERVGRVKYDDIRAHGLGTLETRMRRKDGGIADIILSSAAIDPKDLSKGVIFTVIDLSDRKRAEQALRDSEQRYRQLFERNLAGVYRSTVDGELLECNPSFARIFGFESQEEATRLPLLEVYPDAENRQAFVADLQREGFVVNRELTARRTDGQALSLMVNATLVSDDRGEPTIIEGTVYDTTEHREMEARLRQALKMQAVGQLAAGIAHDFNNLLMAIISHADIMRLKLPPDEPTMEHLDAIARTVERAADLVRKILAFGRKQMLQPEVVDLNSVVRDTFEMLRRTIPETIQLDTDLDSGIQSVRVDLSQIEEVIVNLTINARDAMPDGGSLTIRTRQRSFHERPSETFPGLVPGRYATLEVSDTGRGMDENTMSHAFEPFFTTKGPGHGSGLGLAQVWGTVKQSDGYVYIASQPDRGTTVTVFLPSVNETADDGPRVQKRPVASQRGPETVLVVEDDDRVRDGIRDTLGLLGYETLEARSGDDALATASRHAGPIHLLISDLVMPGLSVEDLVDELTKRYPDLRVLFMSGYRDVDLRAEFTGGSNTAFLAKPFNINQLSGAIRELLDATPMKS